MISVNCFQIINDYNVQVETLKNNLVEAIDKQLLFPIPPSNKKYLQVLLLSINYSFFSEVDFVTIYQLS